MHEFDTYRRSTRSRGDTAAILVSCANDPAEIIAISDLGTSLDLNKAWMESCISPNLDPQLNGKNWEKLEGSRRRTTKKVSKSLET